MSTHSTINIEQNAKGYGYKTIFKGKIFDSQVKVITVHDNLKNDQQIANFQKFCEVMILFCPNIEQLNLCTTDLMSKKLQAIALNLQDHDITMNVEFVKNVNRPMVKCDSGYVFMMNKGLDYFQDVDKYSLGYHDLELRPCRKSTIQIFKA